MTPSCEYRALIRLHKPRTSRVGDIWLCRRLGIVRVMNGHKRGTLGRMNSFHLYHWGNPDMTGRPADWRDNDHNACGEDPAIAPSAGEKWEYVGNMFERRL